MRINSVVNFTLLPRIIRAFCCNYKNKRTQPGKNEAWNILQSLICLFPGSAILCVIPEFFSVGAFRYKHVPASITGSRHQGGSRFWAMLLRHVKEAVLYLLGCKTILINLIHFYWINCHYFYSHNKIKTHERQALPFDILGLQIPLWSPLHSAHCQCRSLCTKREKQRE